MSLSQNLAISEENLQKLRERFPLAGTLILQPNFQKTPKSYTGYSALFAGPDGTIYNIPVTAEDFDRRYVSR